MSTKDLELLRQKKTYFFMHACISFSFKSCSNSTLSVMDLKLSSDVGSVWFIAVHETLPEFIAQIY